MERSIAFYRDILGLEFQGEIFMEGEETDKMFRKENCKAMFLKIWRRKWKNICVVRPGLIIKRNGAKSIFRTMWQSFMIPRNMYFLIDAGIRYYGEVLRTAIVRRKNIKEIPLTHANAEELYYRFVIRRWDILERVIEPKEHGFPCDYTNMFLLQHSEYIPELLIESEEKYRFYAELKRSVKHAEINKDTDNIGCVI